MKPRFIDKHPMSTENELTKDGTRTSQDRKNICNECGGDIIESKRGYELFCEKCGVVLEEDDIDHGPEWRKHDDITENNNRVGQPITYTRFDKGLTTTIGYKKDGHGNVINGGKRRQIARLRKWQKRLNLGKGEDRRIQKSLTEINRIGDQLNIPSPTKETAAIMNRKAIKEGVAIGRTYEGVAASCIYLSCKIDHISRSFAEITKYARISEKQVKRTTKKVKTELSIKAPITSPKEYIPRFASELDATEEHKRVAIDLFEYYKEDNNISGKSPPAIAASVIYAAGLKINSVIPQNYICDVADVNKSTIRIYYEKALKSDPEVDLTDIEEGDTVKPMKICLSINNTDECNYHVTER